MNSVEKVGIIGAGVMGSSIAAHAANAGADVVLLDVVPDAAQSAIEKMKKTEPAPFMHTKLAKRITTGTTGDDLALIKDCDWIIEAIIERPDIKQELYRALEPLLKIDAVLSSNTSTLPLKVLTNGMADDVNAAL